MAYQHPFPESTVTGEFGIKGPSYGPAGHRGRDYAPGGPPAPSIVAGTVVRSERQTGLGNVVVIRNDIDGAFIGYCHLAERYVSVGARVGVGTMIGVVGNTGTLSAGRHLHFTVSMSGNDPSTAAVINPKTYIDSGSSVASGGGTTTGLSADTQKKYQQYLTNIKLYDGLVDGAFGQKSWAAVQQHVKNLGFYGGVADGIPGINTIKGMQTLAKSGGYGGPVDGAWGPNSDAGLNAWLTSQLNAAPSTPSGSYGDPIPAATQKSFQDYLTRINLYTGLIDGAWGALSWKSIQQYMTNEGVYTGAVDGEPGQLTYEGLQKLAAKAGYGGPIDGVFGPKSNEGLSTYIAAKLAENGGIPPVVVPPAQVPGIPVLAVDQIFGVDLSGAQAGIDLLAFASGGGKFVIIKAGGGNDSSSPYIANEYVTHLGKARAAGLKVGHYWMNGNKNGLTPTTSAQYFYDKILKTSLVEGDIVAIDIEAIDGVPAYTPAEAMEFVTELQKYLPGIKVFFYMSSSLVRAGDWKAAVAAGHPLWAAAYNSNDGTTNGGGPNIDDWADWAIWQYASMVARVPGYGANIDCNIADADIFEKYGYKKITTPVPPEKKLTTEEFYQEVLALTAMVEA